MVTTKKTVTRYGRKRYARGYRRYRSLTNQYFRARMEGVYTIAFPQNTGDPVFAEKNSSYISFYEVFRTSQFGGYLENMFGYYKITGVAMEVIPGPNNFQGTSTIGAKTLVGFKFGEEGAMNYPSLAADNNAILLGVLTKARKYVSTLGATGWFPTTGVSHNVGCFAVVSSITGTLTNQPTWTCRFSIYVLYKRCMV